MQTTREPVKVFRYNTVLSVTVLLGDISQDFQFLQTLLVEGMRRTHSHALTDLSVWWPGLIEQYNIGYTEKWIKRPDENFLVYHGGQNPPLHLPPDEVVHPTNHGCLSEKAFSGDVSGMIAESLFIYLLHDSGIDIDLVGHLRPQKRKDAFMPDFAIYDHGPQGCPVLSNPACELPIYVGVKGSVSGINENQINKAMAQLCALVTTPSACGLMFLVFRNTSNLNYEGMLVEVEF